MNKKVLIVTPIIRPGGGPPGYVFNLKCGIAELANEGKLKNTFTFSGNESQKRVKVTRENSGGRGDIRRLLIGILTWLGLTPYLSKRVIGLKKIISENDIIIFQGYQDSHLPVYAKAKGKTVVYMPHSPSIMADEYKMLCELSCSGSDNKHYRNLAKNESLLIKLADHVAFPSQGASIEYVKAFPYLLSHKPKIFIKSGVNIHEPYAQIESFIRKHKASSTNVYFIGRYVSHKGYDLFLSAAALIKKNYDDVKFYTLGDGPMKRESDSVINLGWTSNIFSELLDADIIVVPNRIAYYDLLPLESAAIGKPLVMTSVGGNTDQLADLPDSVACNTLDPADLAEALLVAINILKKNKDWGIRNYDAYKALFTTQKFAKRWDEAISKL